MSDQKIIASSNEEDSESLQELEEELEGIKEDLEDDVEEALGESVDVELREVLELEDDYLEENFEMVAGDGVVGISNDCMSRIERVSEGSDLIIPSSQQKTLRHEWAHNIDGELNRQEYDQIEVESPMDINQAPKEAYAIFEDLRANSISDLNYDFPRGFSAVRDWEFLTDVNEEGEVEWNDNNPSLNTPHRLGYYAAKTLEEAANKRYDDRKEAEDDVRRTLLETTTVDGLLSEISEAHKELNHPFYIDVLDDVAGEVAEKDEYELTLEMTEKARKYGSDHSVDLEQFYRDHALVQSYEAVYGDDTNVSEGLRQQLEEYRTKEDRENFISDNIINDNGIGTSDEYLEWLPG